MIRIWARRTSCLAVALLVGVGVLLSGCQTEPEDPTPSTSSSYQFEMVLEPGRVLHDSFSCLGITDEQFKSVLEPGWWGVGMYSTGGGGLTLQHNGIMLVFGIQGVPSVGSQGPEGSDAFLPYAFYRFPDSMGKGGAVWQPSGFGATATPTAGVTPLVWLGFGGGASASVAQDADIASHDAVIALVRAVEKAGSTSPSSVAAALPDLSLDDAAAGLGGPLLSFGSASALADSSVAPLVASTQNPGVRPEAAVGVRQLFWFGTEK